MNSLTWESRMAERARLRRVAQAKRERESAFCLPDRPPDCCCEWQLHDQQGWVQAITCDFLNCSCDHHGPKENRALMVGDFAWDFVDNCMLITKAVKPPLLKPKEQSE